jgi:prophage regulatory protein
MEIISIKKTCERIGVSRSTLWAMTREGNFPRPVSITDKRRGYVASEIDAWVKARMAARDKRAAA